MKTKMLLPAFLLVFIPWIGCITHPSPKPVYSPVVPGLPPLPKSALHVTRAAEAVTVTTDMQSFAVGSGPATVILAWDASPSVGVTGYAVYFGVQSRVYTNRVEVTNCICSLTGLEDGSNFLYFFAVTAVGWAGLESVYSNEAKWGTEFYNLTAEGLSGNQWSVLATWRRPNWVLGNGREFFRARAQGPVITLQNSVLNGIWSDLTTTSQTNAQVQTSSALRLRIRR